MAMLKPLQGSSPNLSEKQGFWGNMGKKTDYYADLQTDLQELHMLFSQYGGSRAKSR
jgi:hypothetical protein